MSLVTAGIRYTISQRLSGATEDCSIVRGRQLRTLCHQRWCMSASRRMFGSLWNAVAAHEHRQQDGSRRPHTVEKCQTASGVRVVLIQSNRHAEHARYVVKVSCHHAWRPCDVRVLCLLKPYELCSAHIILSRSTQTTQMLQSLAPTSFYPSSHQQIFQTMPFS